MPWIINADGSFDLECTAGALRDCWPAIDHQPLRCARVTVTADGIVYHLAEGELELAFAGDALRCSLRGRNRAPHWILPVHDARIEGFTKVFRQGIGFSGPSGCLRFSELGEEEWGYESYMLLALFDDQEQVCSLAPHQHRDYLFRANLHQRCLRHNFRNREIEGGEQRIELGFRSEGIPLDGELVLPAIHLREGQGLFETLRATAGDLAQANAARAPSTPRYHYCAWYHHTSNLTEELFLGAVDSMAKVDPQRRIQAAQIDDGYCTSRGDWLTFKQHMWPRGLEPVFKHVTDSGYNPGIWVAPFMVGCSSELAKNHPDWLLRWSDGSLITEWKRYDHGSPDFEHYVLDSSHPEALAWIREVFSTFYSWGVRVFKTDFLEWGYKDSTRVLRHSPGKTGAQYFDEVMACIREAIVDSYWLGCITYFAPSIGYMDGMRMTSDVGVTWSKRGGTGNDGCGGGTENMIEESYATLYMNNVLWQNDPDVCFLRDWHIHLNETEIHSQCYWAALLGHSINTSCEIGDLPPERLKLWRWLRPQEEAWTADLPYFSQGHLFRVVKRAYPQANGSVLLVLNEHGEERIGIVDLGAAQRIYRWSADGSEDLGELDRLVEQLPGHGCSLYFISDDGAPPPADLNLGGSFG